MQINKSSMQDLRTMILSLNFSTVSKSSSLYDDALQLWDWSVDFCTQEASLMVCWKVKQHNKMVKSSWLNTQVSNSNLYTLLYAYTVDIAAFESTPEKRDMMMLISSPFLLKFIHDYLLFKPQTFR